MFVVLCIIGFICVQFNMPIIFRYISQILFDIILLLAVCNHYLIKDDIKSFCEGGFLLSGLLYLIIGSNNDMWYTFSIGYMVYSYLWFSAKIIKQSDDVGLAVIKVKLQQYHTFISGVMIIFLCLDIYVKVVQVFCLSLIFSFMLIKCVLEELDLEKKRAM